MNISFPVGGGGPLSALTKHPAEPITAIVALADGTVMTLTGPLDAAAVERIEKANEAAYGRMFERIVTIVGDAIKHAKISAKNVYMEARIPAERINHQERVDPFAEIKKSYDAAAARLLLGLDSAAAEKQKWAAGQKHLTALLGYIGAEKPEGFVPLAGAPAALKVNKETTIHISGSCDEKQMKAIKDEIDKSSLRLRHSFSEPGLTGKKADKAIYDEIYAWNPQEGT